MKHDQVSERGVTSLAQSGGGERARGKSWRRRRRETVGRERSKFLSLFLRFSDIRTRIRRPVERRKIGGTNEVRERLHGGEEDPENIVQVQAARKKEGEGRR